MESLPSETPVMYTPGCDQSEEDAWLRWPVDPLGQDNQMGISVIFSPPAEDPPAPASLPTSAPSVSVSNLASPLCSESDPIEVPASEGIGTADVGSTRPVLDLMDSANGGEYGLENRQQLLEVASPANNRAEGHAGILNFNPARSCHPEPSNFRNTSRNKFSRAKSTGAKYNACAREPKRGYRSPNWTREEKDTFLKVKVEAQTAVKGKDWDFISEVLKDRYAFERSAKSCEHLWGTLLKSFTAIRHHESMNHSSNCTSYWKLDENGRSERRLPKSFSFTWYEMIESICAGKGKLAAGDQHCHKTIESIYAGKGKRPAGDQQWTTKDLGLTSLVGADECSSLLRLADGSINPQSSEIKEGLGFYLQSVLIDVIDVIDVLQSALKPLATILQCEHEEEHEFDAKMKALDKKRRALDLEEIQIKRQRFGQHQRTSRLTCRHKQQAELPVKKASGMKTIPAFKELNIADGPGAHRFA